MGIDVSPAVSQGSDLARRVRNQLYRRSELRRVSVNADGGIVRLGGCVASFYLKQLCISGSRQVPGVHHLVDQIRVAAHG